ncbi:MAG TPA: alpha/beta fold hydrolase [Salinimicrobium sp.]|nr:alpha/beta fold hydrolase [Salinimicrobium sp.]
MVIQKQKNIALKGKYGRPIVTDVYYSEEKTKKPILIFCHGYKGFKDWGTWDLMAEAFAKKDFFFVKFNFSFNGGTLEQPIDFPDLEAFGENNFIKELDDLDVILDWICGFDFPFSHYVDPSNIFLMGHSRGGGTSIIKAAEDIRVKKLVTLAAVSDFAARFPKGAELEAWKESGIGYIENKRTGQKMPHLYKFYLNFKENEERLTISRAAKKLKLPFLILHGSEDETVKVEEAQNLKSWAPHAKLIVFEGSNHVFEASHPWMEKELPETLKSIVEKITNFLKE